MRRKPKWTIDFQHWRDDRKLTSVVIGFKATFEEADREAELVLMAFDFGMEHARRVQPALDALPDNEWKAVDIEVVRGKRRAKFSLVCRREDALRAPEEISNAFVSWLVCDSVQEVLA